MSQEQRTTESEFQAAGQQLDALVQAFEVLPFPEVREMAFDMLQAVDTVHRTGLERLVAFFHAHGQAELLDHAAQDPIIHTLFLLYDLVPSKELTQVEAALDLVRPYIHSHGGEVQVLDVVDGVVHVRLSGACQGCAGSAMTLKRGVEAALREGFPGFKRMEVHDAVPPATHDIVIPLTEVGREPPPQRLPERLRRPVFKTVARLKDVPVGTMRAFDVDGTRVLIANAGGELYAVRNHCPTQGVAGMAPLDLGSFTPPIVVCPWHNESFDIRTGKRADGQLGQGLSVLPLAIDGDAIQLAVNTTADDSVPARL